MAVTVAEGLPGLAHRESTDEHWGRHAEGASPIAAEAVRAGRGSWPWRRGTIISGGSEGGLIHRNGLTLGVGGTDL